MTRDVRMISTATALRPPRLRALLARLAGVGVLAVAAGCSDSLLGGGGQPNSPLSLNGPPFVLMTINGQPLPVEMRRDSTVRVILTEGMLALVDTEFSQELTLVDTPPNGLGVPRRSLTHGTVTVSGTKIHFRASDGAEWDGTASPEWIVYTIAGNSGPITFAFKQGG
jgi:hypothetical protein